MSCRRVSPHTHINHCIIISVKLEYGSQEGQVIGEARQLMQLLNELRVYISDRPQAYQGQSAVAQCRVSFRRILLSKSSLVAQQEPLYREIA